MMGLVLIWISLITFILSILGLFVGGIAQYFAVIDKLGFYIVNVLVPHWSLTLMIISGVVAFVSVILLQIGLHLED